MMRLIVISILSVFAAFGGNVESFTLEHSWQGKTFPVEVRQEIPAQCLDVKTTPDNMWGGDFSAKDIDPACTKTFVVTHKYIRPYKIMEGIQTIAELEVLAFMRDALPDSDYNILVDARRPDWVETGTIPGSTNIPHFDLDYDPILEEDYDRTLALFGIKRNGDKLDVSQAKNAVIFCNGPWCPQSMWMIQKLVEKGYPKEKIKWYRDGMQGWRSFGLTTIKPEVK